MQRGEVEGDVWELGLSCQTMPTASRITTGSGCRSPYQTAAVCESDDTEEILDRNNSDHLIRSIRFNTSITSRRIGVRLFEILFDWVGTGRKDEIVLVDIVRSYGRGDDTGSKDDNVRVKLSVRMKVATCENQVDRRVSVQNARALSATGDMRERHLGMEENLDDCEECSGMRGGQFHVHEAIPGLRERRDEPEITKQEHSSQEPKARVKGESRTTETTQQELCEARNGKE
ncbi:hypothetical protein B0H17DRAFT_1269888 [Mycena rosella]|uniref:Uncharacterized protein n=1 Tax=Mycena rosella TaxID=1033263 RepID=A0AAD7G027_MYCRO|nr:hypothetical protein B0H17DRAFT_1269888 [Mycena rosella]